MEVGCCLIKQEELTKDHTAMPGCLSSQSLNSASHRLPICLPHLAPPPHTEALMSPTRQAAEESTRLSEKGREQLFRGSVLSRWKTGRPEDRDDNDRRNGGTNSITRTSYATIMVSDKCLKTLMVAWEGTGGFR